MRFTTVKILKYKVDFTQTWLHKLMNFLLPWVMNVVQIGSYIILQLVDDIF
jgi:hypothetical protein